jgi:nitrite reductase/ring-hydroxylating ferredoxin subunit
VAEVFVARQPELREGDRRIVKTRKGEVGVFFQGGSYYAYRNLCAHLGGPACEGILINKTVDVIAPDRTYQGQTFTDELHFACPWHGWEYDLKTGECIADRRLKLKKFDVVVRGGEVFVIV